jgi:cardiolipin synthase (CMP-forming)
LKLSGLASSPFLVALALAGQAMPVLVLFLVLEASDWIDGKVAIVLEQRSTLGARLDTVADLTMYAALLGALAILEREVLLTEWP